MRRFLFIRCRLSGVVIADCNGYGYGDKPLQQLGAWHIAHLVL